MIKSACCFCDTSAPLRQIHAKYIFWFNFLFNTNLSFASNNQLNKKKCVTCSRNIHHWKHLEDMYCWTVECFHLFAPLSNACLILEKHVRVLFDGNIMLPAWLQTHHFTELYFPLAGDFSLSSFRSMWSMLRFCFLLWQANIWIFQLYFSEQTITCGHNNKMLGMTSWELYFSINQSDVSEIQDVLIFDVKCQEILHQVNYSQINVTSLIFAFGLFSCFMCLCFVWLSSENCRKLDELLSDKHKLKA